VRVVVIVVAVVVLAASYLTWTAGRLDRLHARVDAAAAALDAQLVRRSAVAAALAVAAGSPAVAAAAAEARSTDGVGHDREAAENALIRVVREAALADVHPALGAELATAVTKVAFARRFYNDAVRDTLTVRRRVIPRMLRLAGSAARPTYFEIDDEAP